jgi:hypothetical protein
MGHIHPTSVKPHFTSWFFFNLFCIRKFNCSLK